MTQEQSSLRLVRTEMMSRTAQERADRFNEAVRNFIEGMDRASSGLKSMGETWERSTMIVGPERR